MQSRQFYSGKTGFFPIQLGTKEQLTKENEEWKQKSSSLEEQKTELEVRMSALKSQYEGRICRLERELREQQERHHEQRDEPPESTNKVQNPSRKLCERK